MLTLYVNAELQLPEKSMRFNDLESIFNVISRWIINRAKLSLADHA